MNPDPPSPDGLNLALMSENVPAAAALGTGLTKREVLSTLVLGLGIVAIAVAIAFLASKREEAGAGPALPDRPRQLVEFHLIERSGRPVSLVDLTGKFLVVDFVFTSCSLSCRVVNERMQEIQRLVVDVPDVQLVSLTVDPRTDTPPVLTKFANGYQADPKRWLFLTGDKAEVYRLIETSFIPKSPELEDIIPGGFTSTGRIMLVDPRGNVRASFDGLKQNAASAVVAEIGKYRKEQHTQ